MRAHVSWGSAKVGALQEPILALRRQLAQLNSAEKEASLCWLQHAKICRATGHFEAASTASLEALKRRVPGAVIEHAKLMWDREQPHRAISKLQQVQQLAEIFFNFDWHFKNGVNAMLNFICPCDQRP